jgi:hypothetical protein
MGTQFTMATRKTKAAGPLELVPFNFRMPRGLIVALDERVDELNRASPYSPTTRSTLIRDLLATSLARPARSPRGR